MKKFFTLKTIILSLLILSAFSASAQIVEPPDGQDSIAIKKNAVKPTTKAIAVKKDTVIVQQQSYGDRAQNLYFEIGGPGLALTVNYDTRFGEKRNGLGYRVGAGYFADGGNNVFTVPLQVNYLFGETTSLLEIGGGTTFLNSYGDNKGKHFIFDRVTGFVGTATLGYRYQPEEKGFNFRIAFVPIFYDEGIIAAGGISFGYTFK